MSKPQLDPAVLVNMVDIVVYADGIKLVLADAPDGTPRTAEPRGAFFMSAKTAGRLSSMLQQLFASQNAGQDKRTDDGQKADPEPEPAD